MKGEYRMNFFIFKKLGRMLLLAAVVLAVGLSGCVIITDSGDKNSDADNTANDGGGVSFNEHSQVYNRDGSLFTGSGVLKIGSISSITVGSVTNGIVNLELPAIPDEYLGDIMEDDCLDFPSGTKGWSSHNQFRLYSGEDIIGCLVATDVTRTQGLLYWYFSNAGKMTCDPRGGNDIDKININANAGWNKVYVNYVNGDKSEASSNNILTREVRWGFRD
jgi:hypothetical protein